MRATVPSRASPLAGLRPWVGAAVLLIGAAACSGRSASDPFSRTQAGPQELRVFVDNQNFNDLRIYALTTRGPQAMGQVGGRSTRNFRLPWRQLDELRFRLEFLAGRTYETNSVNASPGDRLDIFVSESPQNSILRRR